MRLSHVLAAALLLAPSIVLAGDHGIRVSVVNLPTSTDYDYEAADGSRYKGTVDADSGQRLAIMYTWLARPQSAVSFTFGAGLDLGSIKYKGADETQTGLRGEAGASFRVTDALRIDTLASLALGTSTIESNSDSSVSIDGTYAEFGVLVRPVYRFGSGLNLSAELGYMANAAYFEYDQSIGGGNETDTLSGVTVGLGLGYEFR